MLGDICSKANLSTSKVERLESEGVRNKQKSLLKEKWKSIRSCWDKANIKCKDTDPRTRKAKFANLKRESKV